MSKFVTRAYNDIVVEGPVLHKTSTERKLADEITYYENLPSQLQVYFPRLLEVTSKIGDSSGNARFLYGMKMEYYAYADTGKKMIDDSFSFYEWEGFFEEILQFMKHCSTYEVPRKGSDCESMYIQKTEREHAVLIEKFPFFADLQQYKELYLNGKTLKSFDTIWPTVATFIKSQYCGNEGSFFNWIHGDMCLSNILYGKNEKTGHVVLKFIDPRGSFGETLFFGDVYYDLAKLSHSCNRGYEYFINDRFRISSSDNNFDLKYERNRIFYDNPMNEIGFSFMNAVRKNGYDYRKVKAIEGTIFVGMCARHYDSLDRQKAMYMTGLQILNDLYDEIILLDEISAELSTINNL